MDELRLVGARHYGRPGVLRGCSGAGRSPSEGRAAGSAGADVVHALQVSPRRTSFFQVGVSGAPAPPGLGRQGTGWSPFLEAHRADRPTRAVMARFADANAAFALERGTDARGAVGDLPILEEDERSLAVSGRWPLDVVGVRMTRDAVRARVGVASFGDRLTERAGGTSGHLEICISI